MTWPLPSTAAQKVLVGHDTLARPLVPGSISAGWVQLVPLYVRARLLLSTTAQNVASAQETEINEAPNAMDTGCDQVLPSKV